MSWKGCPISCCPWSHLHLPGPLSHLPPRTKWPSQCLLHSLGATGPLVGEREAHRMRILGAHCLLQISHLHHCRTQPSSCLLAWILCRCQWSGAEAVVMVHHLPRPIQGHHYPQAPHLPVLFWGKLQAGMTGLAQYCRWPKHSVRWIMLLGLDAQHCSPAPWICSLLEGPPTMAVPSASLHPASERASRKTWQRRCVDQS